MGFTNEYLQRCWKGRRMWTGKKTRPGDWFLTGNLLELSLVGVGDTRAVDFRDDAFAFVPDTDDLLELLDNQVKAVGADPATKTVILRYSPEGLWSLDIDCAEVSTHAGMQESIHSVLLYALHLMAQPRP